MKHREHKHFCGACAKRRDPNDGGTRDRCHACVKNPKTTDRAPKTRSVLADNYQRLAEQHGHRRAIELLTTETGIDADTVRRLTRIRSRKRTSAA
jgi:hypothetical protein